MKIPISNILYNSKNKNLEIPNIEIKKINNINFKKVNKEFFPSIKIIDKYVKFGSSTPIIINASNEVLVNYFLKEKIGFLDIVRTINRIFKDKEFTKYARRNAKSVNDIKFIDNWARLKTIDMCVR
tara:strand:- start:89 stop:466 length:378 start_codon:yes stop_codon:yes gene_type:complete